jgi:hypothetical protein
MVVIFPRIGAHPSKRSTLSTGRDANPAARQIHVARTFRAYCS